MSEIKVNKLSPRTNCGTVQLGDSGDTITIPAGATITNNGTAAGFGATGAASWDTTVKTSGFTAVSGVGYFVNTTSGAITVTLPASPSAGDVVAVSDYANNFATNNLTLARNGSNIGGVAADSVLLVNGAAVTLVYVDATKGWIVTDSGNQSEASELTLFVTATGGTETTCGSCKIHTFTSPGTFCVSCAGNAAGSTKVSYMVVAGGGGSGRYYGGGGGGGGFRESKSPDTPYTASPLDETNGLAVSATSYPITVGGGGASVPVPTYAPGTKGSDSVFSTITSTGGGFGGGSLPASPAVGGPGGSGGGGGGAGGGSGGTGNTPPVSPPQGQNGYTSGGALAGAGGGATVAGGTNPDGREGGTGATTSITTSAVGYSGGGGGGPEAATSVSPCGSGGSNVSGVPTADRAGQTNRGGGGGADGGVGGSGIVVIRYKFQ